MTGDLVPPGIVVYLGPRSDSPGRGGPPVGEVLVSNGFDGTGPLLGYTTTVSGVLPTLGRVTAHYRAELTDNFGNVDWDPPD